MLGVEKTIGSNVSVMVEYNFGLNDNTNDRYNKGNCYLHAGIKWLSQKDPMPGLISATP